MNFLSIFSGCGGFDLGLEKAGMKCVGQIEIMPFALKVLKRHWPNIPKHTDILTFCVDDGLVRTIQSLVQEKVIQEKKADYSRNFADCCEYLIQAGLLQKMFQGYYPSMPEKTFAKCSPSSKTSGMAFRGEYLIVNTSESPNNAVDSSLSDILETHVPQKFYLSHKAIQGIIRRSKKWGRSGYVFLQEMVHGKTQVQKTLSLSVLELIFEEPQEKYIQKPLLRQLSEPIGTDKEVFLNYKEKQSSPIQSRKKKHSSIQEPLGESEISSLQPQQSELKKLATEYKGISLRRLTPTEKEKLQGFPLDWSLPEGSSLAMQ